MKTQLLMALLFVVGLALVVAPFMIRPLLPTPVILLMQCWGTALVALPVTYWTRSPTDGY